MWKEIHVCSNPRVAGIEALDQVVYKNSKRVVSRFEALQ